MKKNILKFALMIATLSLPNICMIAAVDIPMSVDYVDPKNNQDDPQRTPIIVPHVSLEVHTLYFNNVGYDLTLVLVDEENEVAYTTLIPAHTPSIILPHYLDGDYKIELFPGGEYYFYGWIEL